MTEPTRTITDFDPDLINADRGYGLLAVTAQQAVLPRHLDEGIYAILDADGAVHVVETDGYRQQREHDWEVARGDRPEFIHRAVTLLDVGSFTDYLSRNTLGGDGIVGADYQHAEGSLELWADIDGRKVTAILDGVTGLRNHTATLQLRTSREWAEWASIDGKLLGQVEFAQFIEDHLSTVAAPDGAHLLDVTQTLEAKSNVAFKSQQILASGQRQFRYEETVEAKAGQKGDLTIPGELTLVLRPFQGSAQEPITARFRYRLSDGQLRLGVKLAEPETVLESAFNSVIHEIQELVPVRVNHGRP